MNLSFLPGELYLRKTERGYVVIMQGQEIVSTNSVRIALAKFNSLRAEMEKRFPSREPTPEEKAELLNREIAETLVGHNSLGGRKKKTTAGGTRTFGG